MPPLHQASAPAAIAPGGPVIDIANDKAAPPPSALDLLKLGIENAKMGQLNAAADVLAQSILKDPQSAEAHDALATVLLALDNIEYACKAKAKAVGLGNNSAADWELLGDMFVALGQADDAAQAFGTALALQPGGSPELERKLQIVAAASSFAAPAANAAAIPADIPAAWHNVNLVTIEPEGNPHTASFSDLVSSFESALRALGITVRTRKNEVGVEGVNLLIGAHLIASPESADRLPANTVIVNLEQLRGFNIGARPVYAGLMRRLAVWDYSPRNIAQIKSLMRTPYVSRFKIGYTPEMTRCQPQTPTTDVLFYGSLNDRRAAILKGLHEAGLNVKHLFSVYGAERDAAIADAKIVLNMHFYEDSLHEIGRTSYLLANSKAIVSECGPDTEIEDDIREAMIAVPYKDIVASCVALIRDEPRRLALEKKAFEIFSKRSQAEMLHDAIVATTFPPAA
jgi:hypothetical protein